MNNTIVKLNARGAIVCVDSAILTKSQYFKNLLSEEILNHLNPVMIVITLVAITIL